MPGLSTYDVRLSNYTFWGCYHASIHCLSIAGTRIHRSHEAHDEGMAFDESTPVGNFLSHESTFFSGCAMISIVAFCLTFSWLCQVSKEKMEKRLHNWNSGPCEMLQGMTRAISTCLHCVD